MTTVEQKSKSEQELAEKLSNELAKVVDFEQKVLELSDLKEKLEAQNRENQSEIDLLDSQLKQKSANLIELEANSSQEIQSKASEIESLRAKLNEMEKEKEVGIRIRWKFWVLSTLCFAYTEFLFCKDTELFYRSTFI